MYRINLYREYEAHRRARRQAPLRAAMLSGLLGVELLLVAALALSAVLLDERIGTLRGEVHLLEEQAGSRGSEISPADLSTARELLALRRARIDWYPKLAELGWELDPGLSLLEVTGLPADVSRPARMQITGLSPRRGGSMDAVFRLADRLRRSPAFSSDFATVRLATIEGADDTRFQILCEAAAPASPVAETLAGGAP